MLVSIWDLGACGGMMKWVTNRIRVLGAFDLLMSRFVNLDVTVG